MPDPTHLHPDRADMLDALASLRARIESGRVRGLRIIWDDSESLDYETLGTWDRGALLYLMRMILAADEELDRAELEAEIALLRAAVEEG